MALIRHYRGYTIIKKISTTYKNGRKSKSVFYCVYNPKGDFDVLLSDEKLKEAKLNIDNQIKN